jgi:uncharacterized protein (TIGR02145 family)
MNKQTTRKGVACYAPTVAAGLMLAMAFTLNACGGDGGGGGGGDEAPNSSNSGNGSPSSSSGGGSQSSGSSGSGSSSSGTSSSSSVGDAPSSSSQPPPKCGNVEYDPADEFCDGRGEKKLYKYVEIDGQNWMAENLNYNAAGSKCGSTLSGNGTLSDADAVACDKYGRLYDWATAMDLEATCNSSACSSQIQTKHQGVCPTGWHIPGDAEWDALIAFIHTDKEIGSFTSGSSSYAGKYLKAVNGWNSYGGIVNLDSYDFSALPGGIGDSDGYFSTAGYKVLLVEC